MKASDSQKKLVNICPECQATISQELTYKMTGGHSIICETCGFKVEGLKGIIKVTPTKAGRTSARQRQVKTQTSKDDSWTATMAKWQKDWDDFVKDWKEGWKNTKKWFKTKWVSVKTWSIKLWTKIKKPFISSPVPRPPQSTSTQLSAKYDPYTGKKIAPVGKQPAKFDPFTGKRLINLEDANAKNAPPVILQPFIKKNSPLSDSKKEIYTVLEPEIRNNLLSIEMSEEERVLIAKSFIYLTFKQQGKYLIELENVNRESSADLEPLIQAIKKLPISTEQQAFLIEQLNYIPDQEHEVYVSTLAEAEISNEKEVLPENAILKALEQEKFQRDQEVLEIEGLKKSKHDLERQVRVKHLDTQLSGEEQERQSSQKKTETNSKPNKKKKELN